MRYERPSVDRRESVKGMMTFGSGHDYGDFCEKFPYLCNKR